MDPEQTPVSTPPAVAQPVPKVQVPSKIPVTWKLALVGLLILIPVTAGAFWAGRQSAQMTNQVTTPTPTQITPTLRLRSGQASPTLQVSSGQASPTTQISPIPTCQTVADCYPGPTCNPQVMDQQNGNTSHCPIPECIDGQCLWKPVP